MPARVRCSVVGSVGLWSALMLGPLAYGAPAAIPAAPLPAATSSAPPPTPTPSADVSPDRQAAAIDEDEFGFVDEQAAHDRQFLQKTVSPEPRHLDEPTGPRPHAKTFLTFEQILAFGLQNPMIKAAEEAIAVLQSKASQAKFAWVPMISASVILSPGANIKCDDYRLLRDDGQTQEFQYCRPGSDEKIDLLSIKGYFGDIANAGIALRVQGDLVMPLFTFGKAIAAKKLVRAGVALTKLEKIRISQETVMRTQEAYTALLLARETIAILEQAWGMVQKHGDTMRSELAQENAGSGRGEKNTRRRDPDDVLELEVAEVDIARKLREARRIEATSLAALWAIAGEAAPPHFDVAQASLDLQNPLGGVQRLEHYHTLAWRERPEARMAKALLEVKASQEQLARAMFFPDLALAGKIGIGYANKSERPHELYYPDRANFTNAQIMLALRWRLDLHNRAFELQQARAELRGAEYQRQTAQRLLMLEVDRAHVDLLAAQEDVALTQVGITRARRLVVSQEAKTTVGGGAYRDLSRALTRWAELEFEHMRAKANHNIALARLARAVGTPLTQVTLEATAKAHPSASRVADPGQTRPR